MQPRRNKQENADAYYHGQQEKELQCSQGKPGDEETQVSSDRVVVDVFMAR